VAATKQHKCQASIVPSLINWCYECFAALQDGYTAADQARQADYEPIAQYLDSLTTSTVTAGN